MSKHRPTNKRASVSDRTENRSLFDIRWKRIKLDCTSEPQVVSETQTLAAGCVALTVDWIARFEVSMVGTVIPGLHSVLSSDKRKSDSGKAEFKSLSQTKRGYE